MGLSAEGLLRHHLYRSIWAQASQPPGVFRSPPRSLRLVRRHPAPRRLRPTASDSDATPAAFDHAAAPAATPPAGTNRIIDALAASVSCRAVADSGKRQHGHRVFNLQKSSTQQSSYYISTNQSWVGLNPPYGSTQTITTEPDPITVSVNTASMNVGSYAGVVYIVESGPNGSQTCASWFRSPSRPAAHAPPPPSTTASRQPATRRPGPTPPPAATPPPAPTRSLTPLLKPFLPGCRSQRQKATRPPAYSIWQKFSTATKYVTSVQTSHGVGLNPPYGSTADHHHRSLTHYRLRLTASA